jgi:hypothetical protein
MKPTKLACALLLSAASALALGACGSGNNAASIATVPTQPTTPATSPNTTPATTPTATVPTTTAPTKTAPKATRTATAPAFVQTAPPASGPLGAAEGAVSRAGYTVRDPSTYKSSDTLQVLLGVRGTSADPQQQAFFFVNGRYIGTDARSPSGSLSVVSTSDTAVTVRYHLYRPSDQGCCPSGGATDVEFALNNGMLTPSSEIPPTTGAAGARR